jgi:hypothetical protein
MKYREFVDYVKDQAEDAVESESVNPLVHFFLLNGEGTDGAFMMVPNEALAHETMRRMAWEHQLVPLIHKRHFRRLALIAIGPVVGEDGELEDTLSVGITVADGERMEGWLATIEADSNGWPYLGDWDGPHLDSDIPDWDLLEEALR